MVVRAVRAPCRLFRSRFGVVRAAVVFFVGGLPAVAGAQYFGRNKVQYTDFHFRVMSTPHFSIHFYPEAAEVTADAARMAERWYARHSATLSHEFTDTKPLIFYANQAHFQQTNVISGQLTEATGGVTEALRSRVILPFTGIYAENDHVIGHELVHVFQYDIAGQGRGGLGRITQLPLWLIEGMAEYLSLGRNDPNTALWLRDAAIRNKLPTIRQLTRDPSFFPYRYGQALWAYVGGRWGDQSVAAIYKASLDVGLEQAFRRVTGMSTDSLSAAWIADIKRDYLPLTAGRTLPKNMGTQIVRQGRRGGDLNVSPVVSPDGRLVAFFSSRGLFGVSLYVADAHTGKVLRELSAPSTNPHLDAISFISSAGAWSPDARQLATIVFAAGRNQIVIVDARGGRIVRRIRVPGVTAITTLAWSPDGHTLALSGSGNGTSDLYLYDLTTNKTTQLTNDRYADLQPAWSPDGRTLAFVTDRSPETDFTQLRYAPLQLALIDLTTKQIRPLPAFPHAKHLNPQFSPDGRDLYFVSDQDGFDDVYRYALANGAIARVTRVATGVSGITATSPALSVASHTGRLVFSVFEAQGYSLNALEPAAAVGTPVTERPVRTDNPSVTTPSSAAVAGLLPPVSVGNSGLVATYLASPLQGLPAPQIFPVTPYRPRLQLESIGVPGVGVATGGIGGTQFVGGIAGQFSDMLGNHVLQVGLQVSGTVQDIGGQVMYLDQQRRWNRLISASHVPYLTGFAFAEPVPLQGNGGVVTGTQVSQVLQRIFVDQVGVGAQYPFSTTRRFETNLTFTRYSFSTQIQRVILFNGQVLSERMLDTTSPAGISFGQVSAAFVGDNSFFGFTSPVAGSRFRFEVTPTVGQLQFVGALADYRRYFFLRPVTLAFRGLHYGRYGGRTNVDTLSPLYVGDPGLVRGYEAEQIDASECGAATTVVGGFTNCPALNRLIGSRVAVVNAELRFPLFGTPGFGLFNVPFLPIEIAPFADAGVAWTAAQRPRLRFERNGTDRVPVTSTGVTARFNLFGFAVLELYEAYPFQRPGAGWQTGFQILPGW